jgi:hypothetical protein
VCRRLLFLAHLQPFAPPSPLTTATITTGIISPTTGTVIVDPLRLIPAWALKMLAEGVEPRFAAMGSPLLQVCMYIRYIFYISKSQKYA